MGAHNNSAQGFNDDKEITHTRTLSRTAFIDRLTMHPPQGICSRACVRAFTRAPFGCTVRVRVVAVLRPRRLRRRRRRQLGACVH